MAKADMRARKGKSGGKSVKSKGKAVVTRKRTAASGKPDFMLKDKQSEAGMGLIVAKDLKPARPRKRQSVPAGAAKALPVITSTKPVSFTPPHRVASPAQLPVVWKKNGAADNLGYWLRSTGRKVVNMIRHGRAVVPPTKAPIGAKLRTKNDLLREIAALRQENANMRDRLGLPRAAFGRQVAETI